MISWLEQGKHSLGKLAVLCGCLSCALVTASPVMAAATMEQAQRELIPIYAQIDKKLGNTSTIYCGCPLSYPSSSQWKVDIQECGYKVRKLTTRANKVETEQIVSAAEFSRHLPCNKNPRRKNCTKNSKYRQMDSDMHNLYPVIGEINADRKSFPLYAWNAQPGAYGKCAMVIDTKNKRAQPPQEARGKIARAYLYMAQRYGVKLTQAQSQLYKKWNMQHAPDKEECLRNELIARKQGNDNPFITGKCKSVL